MNIAALQNPVLPVHHCKQEQQNEKWVWKRTDEQWQSFDFPMNWIGVSTPFSQKCVPLRDLSFWSMPKERLDLKVHEPKAHTTKMEKFSIEQVKDFKHVVYNLLVEHHNSGGGICEPIKIVGKKGVTREGFRFKEKENPEKKLPELYSFHVRGAKLENASQESILIQDLYKFYLRCCLELLSKYFERYDDRYTFLYDDIPLFVEHGTLKESEMRIKNMRSRARKRVRKL